MKNDVTIKIGSRKIGLGYPAFIIAEISANHRGDYRRAVKLVKEAKKAGADAVKLQTYLADTMTIDSNKKWFRVGGDDNPQQWKGKTLYGLYKEAYTPWEWQPKLKQVADKIGIILFSTPFDETAVHFLEGLLVPCYKVASYETVDIPLLKAIARTKKPIIISTNYEVRDELAFSIQTLRKSGVRDLAVLHCVTGYTNKPIVENANLRTITDIRNRFNVVSGFSDNNAGIEIPKAAAAYGASIIEKHIVIKRSNNTPDSSFSLEPKEFEQMVNDIRFAEKALGKVHYGPVNQTERYNKRYRRSIFVSQDVSKGQKFTKDNVKVIRPGFGLPPKFIDQILGKTATRNIKRGTPLAWKFVK